MLERKGNEAIKTEIELDEETDYLTQQYPIAVDNDFLMIQPKPVLSNKIQLFARISPENKAYVVRKYKEQIDEAFNRQSCWQKLYRESKDKVGMCGDGANDLMAIRESDLGLGISDSDASYGASFSIVNMLDIDFIIRESKNSSQSIVDMLRYFGSVSFLKIIASILMAVDCSYYNANMVLFYNFAHSIWLAVFLGLSSALPDQCKERPKTSLMSLRSHIVYWVNIIIPTGGLVAAYYYFRTLSEFTTNPGINASVNIYSPTTYTATVVFLIINIPLIFNVVVMYTGKPFKEPIYKNVVVMIFLIGSSAPSIAFFFVTSQLSGSGFAFKPISVEGGGGLLGIMLGTMALSFIVNLIIGACPDNQRSGEVLDESSVDFKK